MRTLPAPGETVYIIQNDGIVPFLVLYVTNKPYTCGTETTVPTERQVAFCYNVHSGYATLRVPDLYATEKECRLELVAWLRKRMERAGSLFDEAYRAMRDEK